MEKRTKAWYKFIFGELLSTVESKELTKVSRREGREEKKSRLEEKRKKPVKLKSQAAFFRKIQ